MPLISRKEFANKCGVTSSYLNNYIRRGKVILIKNQVDMADPENQEFLIKRIGGSGDVVVKKKLKKSPEPHHPEPDVGLTDSEKIEIEKRKIEGDRRTVATIQKIEAEARLKQLQAAKLSGESISLDVAMDIVSQLSQSFITGFRGFCDNLALRIAHESRLSKQQTSDMRKMITEGMNNSIDSSVEQAKVDLKKMSEQYQSNKKR